MASTASPSTPSGGVSTSMWAGQPPSSRGWGRNGETGSAFRGTPRGRPGRGGGGRGGRGGRGGGRAGGPNSPHPEGKASKSNGDLPKDQPKKEAPALTSTSSATSTSEISSSLPAKPSGRAKESKPPTRKASENKPSRKLPPIVVNPPPTSSNNAPPSATTPNRSRRKRSQNKGSTSSVSSSKKSPSSESSSSFLRPEKSPVIPKDLPPHLAPPPLPETPSFDIKHDIDALVERVRAVAMDRPHTPGSHIDWAGDDDDSLPDLDDWGVKSVPEKSIAPPATRVDLISPILAGALKPLPNLDFGSPQVAPAPALTSDATVPVQEVAPTPAVLVTKDADGDHTPRGAQETSQINAKTKDTAPTNESKDTRSANGTSATTNETKSELRPALNGLAPKGEHDKGKATQRSPQQKAKAPLHPSLPPKPVAAIDPTAKRLPRKPPVPVKTDEPEPTEEPPKSGVAESMHAPKPDDAAKESSSSKDSSPERQGLAASMHAPISSSMSAPSHITTHATQSTPSFHPTHGRAHTVGRPHGLRVPFSPSHGSFPDGPHPDGERLSHRDRINHARTHSSPPTGPGTSTARARIHASRPVLTGAAMSQIMRSLGAPAPSKREPAPASAAATTAQE
ncbi:hypothetical protein C8Q78DRAFT_1065992 [Trametes maxima]|nr:hypothetical protein C8Q78DRAFT_1065992 [Trametes maxima]